MREIEREIECERDCVLKRGRMYVLDGKRKCERLCISVCERGRENERENR